MMKNKFLLWFVCSLMALPSMAQSHHSVVYDSTSVVMEESGLSHVAHHVRLRMLDRKGCASNNVLKMDYDPLSAYVEIQKVWVHRADGSTQQISTDVYDYVKPSRSIFWNASQKMVQIGHLDPGDELEYVTYMKGFTYALLTDGSADDQYIPPMRGHFYDIVPFWSNEPVTHKVYTVSVLNTKNLKYKIYGDDSQNPLSVSKTVSGDRTIYTFTKRDIQPIMTERNMVAASDVFCKLLLSTAPNWESKSVWFYGVNESYGSYTPTAELQAKVSELLLGAKSEFDSLNILTHWVADNMRYCGLTMGKGEGYTHHNVTMNFTDRCGVCKDKASLLIAMLRVAGFEAYPVMTMAGSRIDDIPADQFNHSVAVVRLRNGKFQLIDPTWVPNVRELWSSAEQQQGYLIGSPEGLPLMTTPLSDPENHYIRISGRHKITADGTLKGSFTITAEGQSDAAVRGVFSANPIFWQRNLERELLRIAPQAHITDIRHTDNDDYLRQPVTITYHYEIPNYAVVSDNELIFIPITARNLYARAMSYLQLDTSIAVRNYPFKDRCSRLVQITDDISLPSAYKQLHFPPIYGVANPAASFGCGYQFDDSGKTLHFSETVMMGKRVYEASDWPYVRQCVKNQHFMADTPVVLSK